jgi:hypothetical protein
MTVCFASQAAVMTFTNSADYYSALSAKGIVPIVQDYESYSSGSIVGSESFGGVTYTFPSGTSGRIDSNYNSVGDNSLAALRAGTDIDFFVSGETIRFNLPGLSNHVGVFINSPVTVSSSDLTLKTDSGAVATTGGAGNYDTDTLYFAGLIDDTPFTSVTFESTPDIRGFNLDNLSYGSISEDATHAPEPSTFVLLAGGLMAAGMIKRRR